MNIQSQNKISEIPGLYSGDQAKPWSNDGLTEDQPTGDGTDGFDPQDKTSMILLRGKSLLTDLTLEKDSLDKNFVHAHRLLDAGLRFLPINAHHIYSRLFLQRLLVFSVVVSLRIQEIPISSNLIKYTYPQEIKKR